MGSGELRSFARYIVRYNGRFKNKGVKIWFYSPIGAVAGLLLTTTPALALELVVVVFGLACRAGILTLG